MNTATLNVSATNRFAAAAMALMLTLAMLTGVNHLAQHDGAAAQLAQASAQQA